MAAIEVFPGYDDDWVRASFGKIGDVDLTRLDH
jgi:hypothetical protein